MENKKIKLDFEMQFYEISDLNKSFAKAKCLIAYCGRNRNYSDISKQTFIDALPSIKNIPVVARYDADKDDFGGHDVRIVETKDGGIDIANATVPFGLVPESANQWFEMKTLPNGEERECLFTDVILWKRQHGYQHIVEASKVSQSMEINASSYVVDSDGYCVIEKMEWEALTLLGENVEPCFENANLELYSKNYLEDFKLQYSTMLNELKTMSQSPVDGVDIESYEEGGNKVEENVIAEPVEEVVEVPAEEVIPEVVEEPAVVETVEETPIEENVTPIEETPIDETPAEEDFGLKFREINEKYEALVAEFEAYKENYATDNETVDGLRKYQADKMAEERLVAEEAIFSQYEELIGETVEFSELKEKKAEFELDALKKECVYIVGLHNESKVSKKPESPKKFSVEKEPRTEKYGDLFKKYLGK